MKVIIDNSQMYTAVDFDSIEILLWAEVWGDYGSQKESNAYREVLDDSPDCICMVLL